MSENFVKLKSQIQEIFDHFTNVCNTTDTTNIQLIREAIVGDIIKMALTSSLPFDENFYQLLINFHPDSDCTVIQSIVQSMKDSSFKYLVDKKFVDKNGTSLNEYNSRLNRHFGTSLLPQNSNPIVSFREPPKKKRRLNPLNNNINRLQGNR